MKKYWHKLSIEKQNKIRAEGHTYKWLFDNYKQPDWCSYPNALSGDMGCWSLMSMYNNSTTITEKFCMTCDCYEGKLKWIGKLKYRWLRIKAEIRNKYSPIF